MPSTLSIVTQNQIRAASSPIEHRTRLQVLALANDCCEYKMDLVTNGVVIIDAINLVYYGEI